MGKITGDIDVAIRCLKNGGIIAFPTETVYGIGVDGKNKDAYFKLYEIKKRNKDKPIPFLIGDISYLKMMAGNVSKGGLKLAEKFWPGPLTIIFHSSPEFLWVGEKIALRLPAHPICLSLLKEFKNPIATTSANISGDMAPTSVDEISPLLFSKLDVIITRGKTEHKVPSTIIDVTEKPKILRDGAMKDEILRWIKGL